MINAEHGLDGYIDADGKFERLPGKKQKKKLDAMMHFLAGKFDPDKRYSEIEVNRILHQYHSFNDPATLRRLLFGMSLLNRTKDGRSYWVNNTKNLKVEHDMIKIRKAKINDLEELVNAFEAYRVWYRKEPNQIEAKQFLKDRIEQQESVIFIATENDKLLGFTQLYPIFSSTRLKRLWLLNDLFVYKNHRGKGISKMLIEKTKEHCRQTNGCAITLETEISNKIGNKLYPATGFKLNSTQNFYEWTCNT